MVDVKNSDISLDGEINSDHNFGHIMLECFRKRRPNDICQMDAATGDKETYSSVLTRTVQLARSFRNFGLQPGDVITLTGINHLDLRIPYYAGLVNGLPIAGVDPIFKYAELKTLMNIAKPKISFCENSSYELYKKVAEDLELDLKIITFKEGECTMQKFIEIYDDGSPIDNFEATSFDVDKVYAWLAGTSGTSGHLKLVATKHTAIVVPIKNRIIRGCYGKVLEHGQKSFFTMSTPQWISIYLAAIALPLTNTIILQTSRQNDLSSHFIDVVNQYKPSIGMFGPATRSVITNPEKHIDLSCLDVALTGSAKVYKEFFQELRSRLREDTEIIELYGQTETLAYAIMGVPGTPPGSCGRSVPGCLTKLVDPETEEEITEPYKPGHLLYKGPCFTEYYNDPVETAKVFTKDGWLRTGDMLYRDEHGFFYFVERLKMLIKYKGSHVFPTELEEVILRHPSVLEACVTSLEHPVDWEWPVACVVRRPGCDVTEQEIQQLFIDNFSETNQLRGGVIFIDEMPKTSNGKLARNKVRQLIRSMNNSEK